MQIVSDPLSPMPLWKVSLATPPGSKRASVLESHRLALGEGRSWEVEVSRALILASLRPDMERPRGDVVLVQNSLSPSSMSDKKTRPIITPSSLSRRTAATTRSFSSLSPPRIAQPPTLAVIAASPDPSPDTPTVRRVHARSDPETPSRDMRHEAPPVRKSYSSGSGKRKAEEVETESSGTTSKEPHRATFAPEPRSARCFCLFRLLIREGTDALFSSSLFGGIDSPVFV
jgi:hypothetical protein